MYAPWPLAQGFEDPQHPGTFNPHAGPCRLADAAGLLAGWNRSIPGPDKSTWRDLRVADAYVRMGLATDPDASTRTPPAVCIPGAFRLEHYLMAQGKKFWDAKDIRVPVLVVRGERDHWSRPQDLDTLARELVNAPVAKTLAIPDATHFFFLDRPEHGQQRAGFVELTLHGWRRLVLGFERSVRCKITAPPPGFRFNRSSPRRARTRSRARTESGSLTKESRASVSSGGVTRAWYSSFASRIDPTMSPAAPVTLVGLDHVSLAFGHLPLLDEATLQIERGERIAVLGRNGAGKSTLLRIVSGEQHPDAGSVSTASGVRMARLEQEVPLSTGSTVFDVVAEGLGDLRHLIAEYHQAAVQVAEDSASARLETLGRLQRELDECDGWRIEQRVELVLDRLGLRSEAIVDTLSGGWKRRVLLARALVAEPDVLLLDEPTNHLDLNAITWLEGFLSEYPGAVVFVTHDRAFLQRVATRIIEIDRGRLTSWPGNYATFLRKKEEWMANEAVGQEKFDKRLQDEEAWLRQGIKARRTRDEGRVRALMAMRDERAARRDREGAVRLHIERTQSSGQLVIEADSVSKAFGTKQVVRAFSTRILRGDRIGLIGPNGAGKTTLLRLFLGELEPDVGEVRRGANVEVAYYDQQREQLIPERTVFDTVGGGNDAVTVNGRSRHVNAYLRDYLFTPERAQSPVHALSGGERNRLLLARLFTRPANLLVLDEPTNDLDLETLEILEAQLVEWPGTLLLVSHDRAFVNDVVTSTIVFEGDGVVKEYVGGYEDWLRQRTTVDRAVAQPPSRPAPRKVLSSGSGKLSYRERRELEELPARIEALEAEQHALSERIGDAEFYKEPADAIAAALERLEGIERDLAGLYVRWDGLDSRPK